jgi:hypothetical protein
MASRDPVSLFVNILHCNTYTAILQHVTRQLYVLKRRHRHALPDLLTTAYTLFLQLSQATCIAKQAYHCIYPVPAAVVDESRGRSYGASESCSIEEERYSKGLVRVLK